MKKVVVIGAGFSGMSAAYFLDRGGFDVEVFEKENGPGGLIRTVQTQWGPCEIAANGILNSKKFEELAREVGLHLLPTQSLSKRRYIFRGGLTRWPLNIFESIAMIFRFIFSRKTPAEGESIMNWGQRVVGKPATQYLLAPALQGIYAGDISKMSASLILKRFFAKTKKTRSEIRGLVAPSGGMGEFFSRTEEYLKSKGVKFYYNKTAVLEKDGLYVIATSSNAAAQILESRNSSLAQEFRSIERLSLVKVTAFFKNNLKKIRGFGVLFPRDQNVKALGILFNNFIFKKEASTFLSESFIYGGAFGGNIVKLDEPEILLNVIEDRARLYGGEAEMEGFHIQRWPSTLPHYTLQLESRLKNSREDISKLEEDGVFIIGNFLGGIGLSQLFETASQLPGRIKNIHG
jgi:protoporphyrinogen/coproporphyrinogen III oxidase